MDLTEDDLNVLELLPNLILDFYTWVSPVQQIINFIDSMTVLLGESSHEVLRDLGNVKHTLSLLIDEYKGDKERLNTDLMYHSELLNELSPHMVKNTALSVDLNNSILLALIFGEIFTNAMLILSDARNVLLNLISPDADDHINIVKEYFTNGTNKVFIKIRDRKSTINKASFVKLSAKYAEFKVKDMLSKLNLSLTSGQLINERNIQHDNHHENTDKLLMKVNTLESTRHCYVDIFNWYCTCDDYFKCYSEDWLSGDQPTFYASENSNDHDLFRHIRFDKIRPLPFCAHLLVVLIIKLNYLNTYLDGTNQLFQISSSKNETSRI